MKYLLIVLLAIGSLNSFSQTITEDNRKIDLRMEMAGHELQRSSEMIFAGTIMQITGGLIAIAFRKESDSDSAALLGGALAGVGCGFTLYGLTKMGLAGRHLRGGQRLINDPH